MQLAEAKDSHVWDGSDEESNSADMDQNIHSACEIVGQVICHHPPGGWLPPELSAAANFDAQDPIASNLASSRTPPSAAG